MLDLAHQVVVFDKNESVGQKLLMTGKGRCNLTNLVEVDQFLKSVPQGGDFLRSAVGKFTPQDTIAFFNELGVNTVVEANNRVFPVVGGAKGIAEALEKYAKSRGVKFMMGHTITDIEDLRKSFDAVIIATGGMSFPKTGSSGDGYEFAKRLGHKIIPPRPSLCGLQFEQPAGFQGVSVPVRATLDGNTESADMMFTKNGVSGPVIFRLVSRLMGQSVKGKSLVVDFVPDFDKVAFDPSDKPFYSFRKHLPQNIANWLVARGDKPKDIKSIRIPIEDFDPIEFATVTRGGVDINEIDSKTMESRLAPKVYFIGEVLNVDGMSGGFNLQIAFSTATACAASL